MRFAVLLLLLTCSVFGCTPAPAGLLGALDAAEDVPGLEVAADVAAVGDAAADAGPDAPEAPPPADVAAVGDDGPAVVDARPATLAARVELISADRFEVTSAQCSASGWGAAAGPAVTFRLELSERAPLTGRTVLTGTVSPGQVGSLALPEERLTSGVRTALGEPYPTAGGARVDFEARATFRAAGPVLVVVTGCPVVP